MNEEQNNQPKQEVQPTTSQNGLSLENLDKRLQAIEEVLKKENKIWCHQFDGSYYFFNWKMKKCLSCQKHRTMRRQKGIWLCKECIKDPYVKAILNNEAYSQLTKKELLRGLKKWAKNIKNLNV